jgi:3-oxoacyl-[acyl-carrier protein] reductase
MDLELAGRIVVVTGANGGIGDAICRAFLREGSTVVPVHRGSVEKLRPLRDWACAEDIASDAIAPAEIELSDAASSRSGVAAIIARFGRIDVLVNCVGRALERPFLLTEEEEWDEVVDVNLSSVARFTRLVVKRMFMARSGAVVNVASVLGNRFGRGTVAYAVAKAGIIRLSQALALEVGSRGVRVNAVCPGVIETEMSRDLTRRFGTQLDELRPLRRAGRPDEVGPAVVFLASEKSASYITGSTVVVDGGLSI